MCVCVCVCVCVCARAHVECVRVCEYVRVVEGVVLHNSIGLFSWNEISDL